MRFLLDTNIISEPVAKRPRPGVLVRIRRYEGEMALSATVWNELLYGWRRLPDSFRKETLGRYLRRLRLPILPYDRRAASWQADEYVRIGRTLPLADAQIAAVAAVNDLVLVTANTQDFAAFQGLRIENWMD